MLKKVILINMFFVICGGGFANAELRVHYLFDNDAATDISGYGNNGTVSGATAYNDATRHWCEYFGGSGKCITIPTATSAFATIDKKITITFWQRGLGSSTNNIIYAERPYSGSLNVMLPYYVSSTYYIIWDAGSSADRIQIACATTDYRNQWNHWAFTKDAGIGRMTIYQNGTLWNMNGPVSGKTLSMSGVYSFKIGSGGNGSYYGYIDDFRIYDHEMSITEVVAVMNESYLALKPRPMNNTKNVSPSEILYWNSPATVTSPKYDVYLGTNVENMVKVASNISSLSYDPSPDLEYAKTYYWRVDVNDAGVIRAGLTWNFSTQDPFLVDNFEDYADTAAMTTIWAAANASASLEKLTTHEGSKQAMKIDYNTSISPYNSTVVRTYATAQNWTANNIKSLGLYFHGSANNAAERLYITLEDSSLNTATVIYDYPEDLTQSDLTARWNEWNINLQNFASAGVNLASVKKITIGVGDGLAGGSSGTVYFDDIRLYRQRCVAEYSVGDFNGDCVADIKDVLVLAQDWLMQSEGDVIASVPNSSGLIARYTFDETGGSTAADSSGHGYNATVNTAGLNNAWNSQGKYAGCLNFSGDYNTGAVVLVPDSVFNGITHKITISVWVNADTNSSEQMTIFDSNNSNEGLWPVPKWENTVGFETDGEGVYWPEAQPQDYKGGWHHYALVKDADAGIQRLYRDGELVAENRDAGVIPAGIEDFIVGRSFTNESRYGWDMYKGKLDDLRIYNYALSQAQVLNLAGVSQWHQRVLSDADAYEDILERIDFKDFAALAKKWLQQQLWP